MAFFRKADAKVRLIFELPKLFDVFFENLFFKAEVLVSVPLFSISTHLRFSLESGCKITALQHIRQIFATNFFKLSANFLLTRWFVEGLVSGEFQDICKRFSDDTLILLHARVYAYTYNMLHGAFTLFTLRWNGRFLHLHQNICNNHCNPATKAYHTMNQRTMVADHLQRATLTCHTTVTDVADGFQRIYNRNMLIFKRLDVRCRCACDSIWQDTNINNNDA